MIIFSIYLNKYVSTNDKWQPIPFALTLSQLYAFDSIVESRQRFCKCFYATVILLNLSPFKTTFYNHAYTTVAAF